MLPAMSKNTIVYVIWLLLGLCPSGQADVGSPYFEHLSLKQGLSNLVVRDVAQDNQGFIWFATNDGLNRYDGYDIVSFSTDR